ncbi:hypothetical protein [Chelatococcus reniformis]|uniref:Uncharacterized protein n=1 Tax=Chelatococcus reniformis TaxID=1494448 RepID=A0A916UV16_9HYPH|nr:hypothetical protein [Chelatococcus reniformis]GGC88404.1 hypothetical protein GCM10010994_52960 [Chelatococcus reniformis]
MSSTVRPPLVVEIGVLKVRGFAQIGRSSRCAAALFAIAAFWGLSMGTISAREIAASPDQRTDSQASTQGRQVLAAVGQGDARASRRRAAVPGPYYVDFRSRTAASYGHAFIWFGKSSEREVEVAGLHPAGDDPLPYMLGHLVWVPSETGKSYGDLDEEYLTASYRVYMSEADAKRVFAYIKQLQGSTPLWNAATTNCTWFIGRIANYMGLKTPSHLLLPENYVNDLRTMNGGRQVIQLSADPGVTVGQ